MEHSQISHYEIGRLLGRGGMGEVYEARDLDLDRRVALKFVAPEMAADAEALKRFEREARAAAALNHPHIATLFAFERDGSRTFIAMELVGGESLRERIRRGPMPIPEALAVARDVAGALALAHRRGIVHRDVKPENLMFDEDGVVKLMDFGLARAAHASRMTMTGSTLGTAAYMPPESVRGGAAAPGDVFALGVMLHEMIAGALPFSGDSPLALLYTIANEEPKPLREARPDVPEAASALVARMLVKDPEQRPDAATVARELASLTGAPLPPGAGDTVELEVSRVPSPPVEGAGEALMPAAEAALAPVPRVRRRRWGGIALVLLVVPAVWITLGLTRGCARRGDERRHQEAVALDNRGIEAAQRGQVDAARGLFEQALVREPGYGEAMVGLGEVLRRQGERARAESLFLAVLRRPGNPPGVLARARSLLGLMDLDAGVWESAAENLAASFQLDSTSAAAYNNYGLALLKVGRAEEAVPLLERALRRFPTVAALSKNAGLAAYGLGEDERALRYLDRALILDPSLTTARGARACVRARLRDMASARADWRAYLAAAPDSVERSDFERQLRLVGGIP